MTGGFCKDLFSFTGCMHKHVAHAHRRVRFYRRTKMLSSLSTPTRNFLYLILLSAIPFFLISTGHLYPALLRKNDSSSVIVVDSGQKFPHSEELQRKFFRPEDQEEEDEEGAQLPGTKRDFDDAGFVAKMSGLVKEEESPVPVTILEETREEIIDSREDISKDELSTGVQSEGNDPPQVPRAVTTRDTPKEVTTRPTKDNSAVAVQGSKTLSDEQNTGGGQIPVGKETTETNALPISNDGRSTENVRDTSRDSKMLLPNKSPSQLMDCVQSLMKPHYDEIERIRKDLLINSQPWMPYASDNTTRFVAYSENITYFQDIAKYKQIRTLFNRESEEKIYKCMINGGILHYDYGINNCSRVLSNAKRHVMFGKNLYDMRCVHGQSEALTSSPIKDAAYQVGLPEKYQHEAGRKTLTYLHIIQDATVTVYGDVTTGSVDLIPQRCFPNKRIYLPENPNELPIFEEVFSMSQYYGKGMFHANIEDISRMAPYISFLQTRPEIKIHVYDLDNPPVYLSMINIDPRRFINGTVRAKVLYMPGGVNCCLPTLFQTQVESFYLRRNLPNLGGSARDVIVVVKRRRRRNRYFTNHQSIVSMVRAQAEPLGMRVWEFSDNPLPSLNETAHMFNRAFMVIAPHGAGESNLIFTQPGTILLEGLCLDKHDGLVNVVFRTLSHILGGYYYGFYKPEAHCTETTDTDLLPYVKFYLERLKQFR